METYVVEDWSVFKRFVSRRYSLFSLYDHGILLDEESWYSVTPEAIAKHHASRFQMKGIRTVVDACCGVGGNAIQLAKVCEKVHAVDVLPSRLEMARVNACIYEVPERRIEWHCGNFLEFGAVADAVFVSPPWGGPRYKNRKAFDLDDMPISGRLFWEAARRISPNVALFLPRNISVQSLRTLSPGETFEIESNYLNDRCVAVTAYWGSLINVPN